MANRILKGLAVAAGTGLALGFNSGRARVRVFAPLPPSAAAAEHLTPGEQPGLYSDANDDFLNIEPLLDRVERLEARIESIGQHPDAAIADLERRVDENTRGVTLLREHVTEAERRMGEAIAAVQRQAEQTREELPALVEKSVAARIDELQSRFAAEIGQGHQRTLETFERTIDEKISSRISAIERSLAEQAGSIEALRVRAADTDNNLQRLVAAIEKLCERAQLAGFPPPPAQKSETRLPFESQLYDAMERETGIPVYPGTPLLKEEPGSKTGGSVPAVAQSEPKKSRFLFRSLIAAFSLLASRFVR